MAPLAQLAIVTLQFKGAVVDRPDLTPHSGQQRDRLVERADEVRLPFVQGTENRGEVDCPMERFVYLKLGRKRTRSPTETSPSANVYLATMPPSSAALWTVTGSSVWASRQEGTDLIFL